MNQSGIATTKILDPLLTPYNKSNGAILAKKKLMVLFSQKKVMVLNIIRFT